MNRLLTATGLAVLTLLAGCGGPKPGPSSATYGSSVPLAAPRSQTLPTINTAAPLGWPDGVTPKAPAGFRVTAFARGLDHPRQLLVLPNGDVLVAESSSEPHKATGLTDWFAQMIAKGAGAQAKSANRILLLRDADGDGVAETRSTLVQNGLNQPFGMAVVGDTLYVGDTDAVLAFPFPAGATRIDQPGRRLLVLPSGGGGGHWTRSLLASPDGSKLYVGVGSASNIADGGMGPEAGRARVLEITLATGAARPYATGLRNPNSMSYEPSGGVIWTVVNERDMIGDDTPPDYMTGLRDGAFYGWPWSYYGGHVDDRVKPANPAMVARAIAPDYALGAHTASLGLAFYPPAGGAFPAPYAGGAFIGQHGSWNRSEPAGYKVVFVPFAGGRPAGATQDFLTGFLKDPKHAYGRPVGVAVGRRGNLLVADDVGNVVWSVSPAPAP